MHLPFSLPFFRILFLGTWLLVPTLALLGQVTQDTLVPNFTDELVSGDWPHLIGYQFDEQGRAFAYTKDGRVWITADGQRPEVPLLNIREEVANFGDHGLIGFTLDPDFDSNGYFYLLYTVDRHHLHYLGTPSYDPTQNEHAYPSIGRLTRYQADGQPISQPWCPIAEKC